MMFIYIIPYVNIRVYYVYVVHCTVVLIDNTTYITLSHMHSVYTLQCIHYTLHSMYNAHCKMYSVQCTLYTVECTLYTLCICDKVIYVVLSIKTAIF